LAKLISPRRTLLVLDGLEPLQNPPGPQEGRLREPSLQALLRELAAFNTGLCVITTRTPVVDIADHERTSALRRDLEQLSSDAGAQLLQALGVKGDEADLRSASNEFSGHCLALTLLGSYLTDAYHGDIRRREEVSARLAHDLRQGVHARKVMESYQSWLGEGPELAILRMLGLFDRPADEQAFGALLKSREALHEVYIPRIQRGNACFAANVLGATGPLLSALVHFFEHGRWGSLAETAVEGQSLTEEDKLFILMQAGLYLSATRGPGAPEAGICYQCAEPLCHSLNRPRLLSMALGGQFRYTLHRDKLSRAIQIAERLYSLAHEQNDAALMPIWQSRVLSGRLRGRSTIREAWCLALALRRRPVLCGRVPYASCQLSDLLGHVRMAFRRNRLLRRAYGRSDLNSKGTEGYELISHGAIFVQRLWPTLRVIPPKWIVSRRN
jgi:hypothetical protein